MSASLCSAVLMSRTVSNQDRKESCSGTAPLSHWDPITRFATGIAHLLKVKARGLIVACMQSRKKPERWGKGAPE